MNKMNKIEQLEYNIEQTQKKLTIIHNEMLGRTCRCEMHISGTDIGIDFYFDLTQEIGKNISSILRKKLNHYQLELYWEKHKIEQAQGENK